MISLAKKLPFVALVLIALSSCNHDQSPESKVQQKSYLGTIITITLYGSVSDTVFDKIFARIADIDQKMSAQRIDSEINQVGDAAGDHAVKVSDDTFFVVKNALEVASNSRNSFDPAIGPIVRLWNIGGTIPHVASDEELAKVLPLVDWRNINIDEKSHSVYLKKAGMRLDLGGIAKGYAADEAARICREENVKSALLDLGGNILVVGSKPDGSDWKIGIQDPFAERGNSVGVLSISDQTAVTSGPYERFFMENGIRYHHIMDPRDGKPARSGIEQVTLVGSGPSMFADGYTKPCFILGVNQGLEILKAVPQFEVIFVDDKHHVYMTQEIAKHFRLTNDAFTIEILSRS